MRKLSFALLAGALLLILGSVAASAQTYNQVNGTVTAGGTTSITLGPFDPFSTVSATLNSDPINLGTATANAQGYATFNFKVPANFSGAHHVSAAGTLNGQPKTYSSPTFQVKAPTTTSNGGSNNGNLGYARTGANNSTVPMAIGGASAVIVGAGLVAVATQRRRQVAVAAAR